jgi:hypothetical protein
VSRHADEIDRPRICKAKRRCRQIAEEVGVQPRIVSIVQGYGWVVDPIESIMTN